MPIEFRTEVNEFLQDQQMISLGSPLDNKTGSNRLNLPSSDDDQQKLRISEDYLNKTFKKAEVEDKNDKQAFKDSQKGFNQTIKSSKDKLLLPNG